MEEKEKYRPQELEPKWEKLWEKHGLYKAIDFDKKPKKYILIEFPYPSGERLHVGHARSYTALDAMARMLRMEGYNVLFPMGWDAFGLPAENYAIKTGINPAITTKENIDNARVQAKRWGLSFDWSREINTTNPKYYKWTQWIFLKLYEKGLAYRAEAPVNWCPACKTNLADEEVLADGTHERCGNKTERRMQKQWLLKITAYADRLLEDLKEVDYSPKIALQQINWIGRSEGVEEFWQVKGLNLKLVTFTTWLHTTWGATFHVIAPEHPIINELVRGTKYEEGAKKFVKEIIQEKIKDPFSIEKEKKGYFTGRYAINHLTGWKMPIYIGNFAVMEYGTGIVKGCPAHDKRDYEFAKKYNLPIKPVISPKKGISEKEINLPYIGEGVMINAGAFSGMKTQKARAEITKLVIAAGNGQKGVHYHLRDWIFSRQHYWGEPIPIIHCPKCGAVPVPEKDLPVELPYLEKFQPSGTGESPLANAKEWLKVACPECGAAARRETDTMPNWAGSNWYYVAYIFGRKLQVQSAKCKVQSESGKNIFEENKELLRYWLPVDLYNGGMEHTTLHLLYSRFIYKFLYDIGVVPTAEPYAKRRSHGVVLGPDSQKMSKSLGNVVNPDEVIQAFGADAFRLYESFMGPFDQMIAWSQEGLEGCSRFLKRVWVLVNEGVKGDKRDKREKRGLERKLHQTIKKVGEDIDKMKFNTAVAAMMEFVNQLLVVSRQSAVDKEILEKFLLILAPFAPHITEELWQKLGNKFSIHQQKWPEYDPDLIEEEVVTIAVQVNGKLRGTVEVQSSKCKVQSEIERTAKGTERVKKYFKDQKIKKVVFVPGKLINFVVG